FDNVWRTTIMTETEARAADVDAPTGAHPTRASDAERHATVLILQDAVSTGLLTTDEGSDRIAAAYAATHRRDLPPLVADLPRTEPATTPSCLPSRHWVLAV